MWSQDNDSLPVREVIETGRPKLFDFEYPIFDSKYKGVFETHFIRNFYMREIGFETEGLFKFNLESWLLINMPYFNKMFESELLKFDPLVNSKTVEDSTKNKNTDGKTDSTMKGDVANTNKTTGNVTQSDTAFNRKLENDTPDSRLAITTAEGKGIIEYASQIDEQSMNSDSNINNDVTSTGTQDSSTTGNVVTDITELETYLTTREGKVGAVTYSEMLMEYRKSFARIEKQMFEEMQQLFMLVY